MSWKTKLDKYLTSSPPEDGFDGYCESIIDNFTDSFYEKNVEWVDQIDGQFNKWLQKIFYNKDLSPKKAAKLIERVFKIYKL
jgi:hypothetical protein